MTDLSAPPAPAWGGQPDAAGPILVGIAGPAPQRRLTVLARGILAIPHLIVLYVLGVVSAIVLVITWFAALFTGRAPAGPADFLTGFLRWSTRVSAYLFLLTDQYPPFSFADEGYPVQVMVRPGRLNRLAVLFRLILVIPVAVVQALVIYGASGVVGFIAWLITLVSGRLPGPLHEAYAAVLRFQVRYVGYYYLLTGVYPRGLFGDKTGPAQAQGAAPWAQPPAPQPPVPWPTGPQPPAQRAADPPLAGQEAEAAPAMPSVPAPSPSGFAEDTGLAGGVDVAGEGAAPGFVPVAPVAANPWALILSTAGKRLVALFLVLGVVYTALYATTAVILASNAANGATAALQIEVSHQQLLTAMHNYGAQVQGCQGSLSCVTGADAQAAQAFGLFGAQLGGVSVPASASGAQATLESVTSQTQHAFQTLSQATSVNQYQQEVASTNIQAELNQFDADYQNLVTSLLPNG